MLSLAVAGLQEAAGKRGPRGGREQKGVGVAKVVVVAVVVDCFIQCVH